MTPSTISHLYTYPIKSTIGQSLKESEIFPRGLQYDRQWGLFDQEGVAITGRTHRDLLRIGTSISNGNLAVYLDKKHLFNITLEIEDKNRLPVSIFSGRTEGIPYNKEIDDWFSNYLKTPCRFLHINEACYRPVMPKDAGKEGDTVNFVDQCPILLVSEASLADLKSRIDHPVSHRNFRPNIVVSGDIPYEEDKWKRLRIGDCEFEVNQPCERCVFITIDPDSRQKHPHQEPLRTLATYHKNLKGGATFGIHMTPRKLGKIRLGDRLEVLQTSDV